MMRQPLAKHRHGVALLLVVCALGVVAVLGTAMLASASLQVQTSRTASMAFSADALAESGVELANYYLLYPSRCTPVVVPPSYWGGGTNITFGASVPGSVDVAVTSLGSGNYRVVSTGKVTRGNATITRTVTAQMHVDMGYQTPLGANFNTGVALALPLKTTITGDVQTNALTTLAGRITGKLVTTVAPTITGLLTGGWTLKNAGNAVAIPAQANLRDFSTYRYLGRTFSAQLIGDLAAGTNLGPTATNPAGVYRATAANLNIASNVHITGTLIVEGNLTVGGTGITVTAQEGFPAAIIKGTTTLSGVGVQRDIGFTGMTWLGGTLGGTALISSTSHVDFIGGVLFGNSASISATYLGSTNVTYDATKIVTLNIDGTAPLAGVTVSSFKD
jgi:hypothetical protein